MRQAPVSAPAINKWHSTSYSSESATDSDGPPTRPRASGSPSTATHAARPTLIVVPSEWNAPYRWLSADEIGAHLDVSAATMRRHLAHLQTRGDRYRGDAVVRWLEQRGAATVSSTGTVSTSFGPRLEGTGSHR